VPVKKNTKLLSESERLRAALFEAFVKIPAEAVVPSGWITSLVLPAFRETCAELRLQLGSGDWLRLGTLQTAVWADLAPRFVLDLLDVERLARLREITARDTAHIVALWRAPEAVEGDGQCVRLSGAVLRGVSAGSGGAKPGEALFRLRVSLDDTIRRCGGGFWCRRRSGWTGCVAFFRPLRVGPTHTCACSPSATRGMAGAIRTSTRTLSTNTGSAWPTSSGPERSSAWTGSGSSTPPSSIRRPSTWMQPTAGSLRTRSRAARAGTVDTWSGYDQVWLVGPMCGRTWCRPARGRRTRSPRR